MTRRPFSPALMLVLAVIFAAAVDAIAQNPRQTPAPAPRATPAPRTVPYNEDPNVPGISRQERFKRQEALIQSMVRKGREDIKKQAEKRLQEKLKSGQSVIGGLAGAQGAGIKIPGSTKAPMKDADGEASGDDEELEEYEPIQFMTFFMDPLSVTTHPGETFSTECRLLNLDRLELTRFELVLDYPPEFIEPVSINHNLIKPLLRGDPEWGIDRERGEIHYSARLDQIVNLIDISLLQVTWRALRPADDLEIQFYTREKTSRAFRGSQSVTHNVFGARGPMIGSFVRVTPTKITDSAGDRVVTDPLVDFAPAMTSAGALSSPPPKLWVDYAQREVYEPGQWVVFEVGLDNSAGASFSMISLALEYDPNLIEFADTDKHNWIHRGTNVLDGPFREHWNWQTHIENSIEPERGVIQYSVASSRILPQPSGVVFRAAARVKRLAKPPLVNWIWNDGATGGETTTGVYLLGENLLDTMTGLDQFESAGAGGARIAQRVQPPPERADPAIYRERNPQDVPPPIQVLLSREIAPRSGRRD